MKIEPEDMDELRDAFTRSYVTFEGGPSEDDRRDIALASILIRMYDRGYDSGYMDGLDRRYGRNG